MSVQFKSCTPRWTHALTNAVEAPAGACMCERGARPSLKRKIVGHATVVVGTAGVAFMAIKTGKAFVADAGQPSVYVSTGAYPNATTVTVGAAGVTPLVPGSAPFLLAEIGEPANAKVQWRCVAGEIRGTYSGRSDLMGGTFNAIASTQHTELNALTFASMWDDFKYAQERVTSKAHRAVRPFADSDLAFSGAVSENVDLIWLITGAEPDNTFEVEFALHYEFVGDDSKLDEVGGTTPTQCDVNGFDSAAAVASAAAPHIVSGKMGWRDIMDATAHLLKSETRVMPQPQAKPSTVAKGPRKGAKAGSEVPSKPTAAGSWFVNNPSKSGSVALPWDNSSARGHIASIGRFFANNADVLVPALVSLLS
jgi:hypothetical protein